MQTESKGEEEKKPFGAPHEIMRFGGAVVDWIEDGSPHAIVLECTRYNPFFKKTNKIIIQKTKNK